MDIMNTADFTREYTPFEKLVYYHKITNSLHFNNVLKGLIELGTSSYKEIQYYMFSVHGQKLSQSSVTQTLTKGAVCGILIKEGVRPHVKYYYNPEEHQRIKDIIERINLGSYDL